LRRPWSGIAFLALLSLAFAACGSGEGSASTTTTSLSTTTAPIATTTVPEPPTTGDQGSTTSSEPASTTTTNGDTSTTTSSDLPGEPIEFGPAEGDQLAVIGVAHDDVLNLRAAPGAEQGILEEIPPLFAALTARGHTRQLPGSQWIEVDYQGTVGWVNLRYIGYLGDTDDVTSQVIEELGGRPEAATMIELGEIVAMSLGSEDPESDYVVSAAPTSGDLGEVTYEVIGLGDDSVRGLRVHVFGEPLDGGFSLRSVEVTALCGRGVTDDRQCI